MKRMVGEDLPNISPSTGVADKSVQVIVRPSAAAVRESDSTWTKLKDNEEAATVVMDTSRSHSHPVSDDPTPIMNTSQNDSHPVSDPTPVMNTSQTPLQAVSDNPTPILSKSRNHLHQVSNNPTTAAALPPLSTEAPLDICKHALQNAEKILREPGWLVYLTDTGGQIEFQELLPQLVSGPTVFFLVFPLDKKLEEQFKVEYVYHDGKRSEPYTSAFTMQDAPFQSLASIASMGSNEAQAFFVEHIKMRFPMRKSRRLKIF